MKELTIHFDSEVLNRTTRIRAMLPEADNGIGMSGNAQNRKAPVLWLLHGATDDDTSWHRRTSIERFAAERGIAVIAPTGHLGAYLNSGGQRNYETYIAEELRTKLPELLPVSSKLEHNFIAGQSMGGYGALRIGLRRPEQYSAVACLSSGNLIDHFFDNAPSFARRGPGRSPIDAALGADGGESRSGNSAFDVLAAGQEAIDAGGRLPRVLNICGTDDFLIDSARRVNHWFEDHPQYDYQYVETPGGHEWEVWDRWAPAIIDWCLQTSPASAFH